MSQQPANSIPRHSQDWFTATHWSIIFAAKQADPARAQAALEQMCRTYWYPLYAYARRSGKGPHDAEDMVQSFFVVCLEKNYLGSADPRKGRFRSFLLVAFKRFLANQYHKDQTAKRGGQHLIISLDALDAEQRYAVEPADRLNADTLYDRRWALTLLEQALARLQQEQVAAGRGAIFEQLKSSLVSDGSSPAYVELAARLGMSEGAIKVAVHRLRQRYGSLLEDEIANTVDSPSEVEAERQCLLAALST